MPGQGAAAQATTEGQHLRTNLVLLLNQILLHSHPSPTSHLCPAGGRSHGQGAAAQVAEGSERAGDCGVHLAGDRPLPAAATSQGRRSG